MERHKCAAQGEPQLETVHMQSQSNSWGLVRSNHAGTASVERKKSTKALAFIVRSQPIRTIAVVTFSMLASFAEGLGIAAFIPLLGLMVDMGAGENWLSTAVHGIFEYIGVLPTLPNVLALMVLAILAKATLVLLSIQQAGFAAAEATSRLRLLLVQSLLHARWSYFAHLQTGRTSHSIVNETARAASVYTSASKIAVAGVQTAVYLLLALAVSWYATLLAIALSVVTFFALGFLMRMVRQAGQKRTAVMQSLSNRLVETIGMFKPLKAMRLEHVVVPLLEEDCADLEKSQKKIITSKSFLAVYYEPLFAIILAVGIFAATTWFQIQFVDLIALALLFYRSGSQLVAVQRSYQSLVADQSVLILVHDLIEETRAAHEVILPGQMPSLERGIRFEQVAFDHGEEPIFRDLSLTVPAGEITAMYGPSGSGKSTVLDLLIGLVRPTSGTISLDENDLTTIDAAAWREMIGYVPQDNFLFHETIAANIRLGDDRITDDEIREALRAAAADFVDDLPRGLNTLVGERGSRLSGGERQRIALARALVRWPTLLILDEATSALDAQSEEAVLQTLLNLKGQMTIVLVTHRPALLSIASTIYHLEGGIIKRVEASQTQQQCL